ncbi:MAG: outer membrane beta-barrel protein [Alphaproteobacteria bacterium]|nr:outer membrane beta-barrel protein [Alphaproteobacteria bacterium]
MKERFDALHRQPGFVVGGWQMRPSLALSAGYDNNITLASAGAASSAALGLRGNIDAVFQGDLYAIELGASAGHTWYPSSSGNDVTGITLRASLSHELGAGARMRLSSGFAEGTEQGRNSGIIIDGVFEPYATRPAFRRIPVEAALEFARGPLSAALSARAENSDVDPLSTQSGLVLRQDFRNGWESEVRLRTSYELHPELELFAEGSALARRYDDAGADNDVWQALVGGRFELTRLLLGQVHAGIAVQSFPNGGSSSGFSFGARFRWFPDELLTITLEADRDAGAEVERFGGVSLAVPVTRDSLKIRAEFEPLRTLMVFGQAGFEEDVRDGDARRESALSLSAGAAYAMTANLKLQADCEYLAGTSNFAGDFDRFQFNLGVTAAY